LHYRLMKAVALNLKRPRYIDFGTLNLSWKRVTENSEQNLGLYAQISGRCRPTTNRHIRTSYTKFIVMIHFMDLLQAASNMHKI
jgi:hypothetical protein